MYFYKQFILVGVLSIFLGKMDSEGQSTLKFIPISRSLHEVHFNVTSENSTIININVTDAYDYSEIDSLLLDKNTTEYFVPISNLTSGSLFTVAINDSYNTLVQNISTRPEAIRNITAISTTFTSVKIIWNKYEPPQKQEKPKYQTVYEANTKAEEISDNFQNLSKLSPGTKYQFNISVLLYNISSKTTSFNFSTLPVTSPKNVEVVALNTSALNVTWTISKSEISYPEYVKIITEKKSKECVYNKKFCVIEVGQTPGKNHSLNIFSTYEQYKSQQVNKSHPTKPQPPNCFAVSSNTSLTVNCSLNTSDFDYYLIYFNETKDIRVNTKKNDGIVKVIENLQPKTEYRIIFGTSSGTEKSANSSEMFYTNPFLGEVSILLKNNSVFVRWDQNFKNCNMCLLNGDASKCEVIKDYNNVTFYPMKAGMRYRLNVSCYGKWSNFQEVIVPPLPPSNLSAVSETHSINLNWDFDSSKSLIEYWFISIDGHTFNISNDETQYKISNLTSGTNYNISIWSYAANRSSSKKTISITTHPECLTILHKVSFTNSSITVNLSKAANTFDNYKFVLWNQTAAVIRKNVSKTETNVTFSSLEAGVEYNISVHTMRGELQSKPCDSTIIARTIPNSPVVECQPAKTHILVKITKGSGYIDGFEVQCSACENFTMIRLNKTENSSWENISQLNPNQMYSIVVRSFAGNLTSENVTCNSTTNESAPSEVIGLKAEEVGYNTVNVTWTKPKNPHGIIRGYIVEVIGQQVGTNENYKETSNSSEEFYKLEVKPGYQYNVTVNAFTVEPGPAKSINFTSKTHAPGFKIDFTEEMRQPNKSTVGQRSFTVEFTNPFTEDNGLILNYTVIVSTSNKIYKNQQSVLPNWYQFHKNPSINAYQVISNCTNLYEVNNACNKVRRAQTKRSTEMQSVKFEIGVTDCSKENTSYCNGYLEAGKNYYVKVRAYTRDAFQDTPFSEVIRTESEKPAFPSYAIALAVICPLVTLLFAGLAFYLVKKKRLPKTSKVEKDSGHFNMPRYKLTSHPVNLIDFKDHVIQMSADTDFRFAEEYEDLKDVGKNQEQITAQLACNRNKNRFANILPYDHSRVKLSSVDDEEGSDYINANYLPGFNSRREYIVTQGPLCSTRDDFWRMISEQNVHNIVMLTKCFEKSREKCDQYWPLSGESIFYGDVQVSKLHETITPDWTITEFKITVGEKSWKLCHFHFTSWPDFGVPNSPQVLVNFVQTVRRNLIKNWPIVVHCSAGVGRSGTFIAVDHCMQHIQAHDSVDVLGIVYEMRLHRILMVQTEQQYIYIHHCLLNVLEVTENEDIYQNVIVNQNGGHDNQAFLEDDEGIHVA